MDGDKGSPQNQEGLIKMIVKNKKLAKFANLSVGTILGKEEGDKVLDAYREHVRAADQARYDNAVKSADTFARIVEKTWQSNGLSLRRGEIVFVKKNCDGLGSCMVTRSKSKSAQGTVWTCGWDEVVKHSSLAADVKREMR